MVSKSKPLPDMLVTALNLPIKFWFSKTPKLKSRKSTLPE